MNIFQVTIVIAFFLVSRYTLSKVEEPMEDIGNLSLNMSQMSKLQFTIGCILLIYFNWEFLI